MNKTYQKTGRNPNYTINELDLLAMLKSCGAYYKCPEDEDGNYLGPLVGYAGEYESEGGERKKYVGAEYFNFSQADQWPEVLEVFASILSEQLEEYLDPETVILGAPMAGIKFSMEIARINNCRHIFAEKTPARVTAFTGVPGTSLSLSRYQLFRGDRVVICEELVNNCSTTKELIHIVEEADAEVVAILCAINRSYPFMDNFNGIPIMSALERPTVQYRQHDPKVARLIEEGNIIWKPKLDDWPRLQQIMRDAEAKSV